MHITQIGILKYKIFPILSDLLSTGYQLPQKSRTHSISGKILRFDGIAYQAGVKDVTVTLSGSSTATTTTDDSGAYRFAGLIDGCYSVSAQHNLYNMSVVSGISYVTINGTDATVNFNANPITAYLYTISGSVTLNGAGQNGAFAALYSAGAWTGTVTTTTKGAYPFAGRMNPTNTVASSLAGYTFSPASAPVTVYYNDISGTNFTAIHPTYTVSGTVTLTGACLDGAITALSGAGAGTIKTSTTDAYTFLNYTKLTYAVTPSLAGYAFTPANAPTTTQRRERP